MLDFAGCFGLVEVLGVLDIYGAGERPIEGVSSAKLVEAIRERGHLDCRHYTRKEEAVEALASEARGGDLLLLLGAGDVNQLAPAFLLALAGRAARTDVSDASRPRTRQETRDKRQETGDGTNGDGQPGERSW
jgi:UDP-N-acetylmuramate--alanine ligase